MMNISSGDFSIFCDLNHILALYAVLKTPIESYFPAIQGVTHPYCRIITGRNVKELDCLEPGIRVMWTTTNLPKELDNFITTYSNNFYTMKETLIQIMTNLLFWHQNSLYAHRESELRNGRGIIYPGKNMFWSVISFCEIDFLESFLIISFFQ